MDSRDEKTIIDIKEDMIDKIDIDDDAVENNDLNNDVKLSSNLEELLNDDSFESAIEDKNVADMLIHNSEQLFDDEMVREKSEKLEEPIEETKEIKQSEEPIEEPKEIKQSEEPIEEPIVSTVSIDETQKIEIPEELMDKTQRIEIPNEIVDKVEIPENTSKLLNDESLYNDSEDYLSEKMENLIKNNNIKNAEMAEKLVSSLEEEEINRNQKNIHSKNKKNILFLLGIVLELLIIAILVYNKVYAKPSSNNQYNQVLTCTSTSQNDNQDYAVTTKNVYYFNENNKVYKNQNSTIYIFDNKNSYDNYKKGIINNSVNFLGYDQKNIFDDINYVYENKIIYDYNELKNNGEVKVTSNSLSFKLPNEKSDIVLSIDSYDKVLSINNGLGFICE